MMTKTKTETSAKIEKANEIRELSQTETDAVSGGMIFDGAIRAICRVPDHVFDVGRRLGRIAYDVTH